MNKTMKNNLKLYLSGIPIGLINGFFGSGGGIAAVFILEKYFKMEPQKAHAAAVSVILPLSAASLFVYRKSMAGNWPIFIFASIGGVAGGVAGAAILKKMPQRWLKTGFGGVMVMAALRMITA